MDEKQENLNMLVEYLNSIGENALSEEVVTFNNKNRDRIKSVFALLPRCVFQGDLNSTNLLIRDNKLCGLIDFNLSGTEVNINCFLAETNIGFGYEIKNEDDPKVSLERVMKKQDKLLSIIFSDYTLNQVEKSIFHNYRNLIMLSQYPNVCEFIHYMKNGYRDRVLNIIKEIIK